MTAIDTIAYTFNLHFQVIHFFDLQQEEYQRVVYVNFVSANSQMKCQSRPADNLFDNTVTSKPSGAYNVTSYDLKNVTDVFTKEGFCLMDNPLKLNLQEKNDTSSLPKEVDYQAMAESRVVHIDQEADISDSICSEQLKVCVFVRVCVCACVSVHINTYLCYLSSIAPR